MQLTKNYESMDEVGKGGFGVVCRARNRTSGIVRAIKRLDNTDFFAEITALSELDHPNIVRLIEYYQTADDQLYLVEELCSGETLEAWMRSKHSPDEVALVMRQILRGLLCCHCHGIAHRDLKPDNFVFASPRELSELKLIDFGLTKMYDTHAAVESEDAALVAAAGTLEFSAPETLPTRDEGGRLLHKARYTAAADMWACGAILFEILCGEPLVNLDRLRTSSAEFNRMVKACFGAERDLLDDTASMVRSSSFLARRLQVARARAPPAAFELLEQLLQVDPQRRPSAQQALQHRYVANAFEHYLLGGAPCPFDTDVLDRMRAFASAPAIARLGVLVEAHLLGPSSSAQVCAQVLAFRSADTSGEGVLDRQELEAMLRARSLEVPADLTRLIAKMDASQDGVVQLVEFLAATMEPQLHHSPQLCKAAFKILDADGDGFLTAADIAAVLNPSPKREETAAAILASAAPDEQGRVTFERFLQVMQESAR